MKVRWDIPGDIFMQISVELKLSDNFAFHANREWLSIWLQDSFFNKNKNFPFHVSYDFLLWYSITRVSQYDKVLRIEIIEMPEVHQTLMKQSLISIMKAGSVLNTTFIAELTITEEHFVHQSAVYWLCALCSIQYKISLHSLYYF
jgi:hypothetical protein